MKTTILGDAERVLSIHKPTVPTRAKVMTSRQIKSLTTAIAAAPEVQGLLAALQGDLEILKRRHTQLAEWFVIKLSPAGAASPSLTLEATKRFVRLCATLAAASRDEGGVERSPAATKVAKLSRSIHLPVVATKRTRRKEGQS